MQLTTIGLDIAKNVFQVHGIDATERVVTRSMRCGRIWLNMAHKSGPNGLDLRPLSVVAVGSFLADPLTRLAHGRVRSTIGWIDIPQLSSLVRSMMCYRYSRSKRMRKAALLVFIATFAPQAATTKGGIRVLNSIPDAYWGKWAPGERCKDGDTEGIVLSAKAYVGLLGKCDVASVSETPSPKGSTYSARLQCAASAQAQKKTSTSLIIRPDDANQISVGPGFESLGAYQRCSESPPSPKYHALLWRTG